MSFELIDLILATAGNETAWVLLVTCGVRRLWQQHVADDYVAVILAFGKRFRQLDLTLDDTDTDHRIDRQLQRVIGRRLTDTTTLLYENRRRVSENERESFSKDSSMSDS